MHSRVITKQYMIQQMFFQFDKLLKTARKKKKKNEKPAEAKPAVLLF